MESTTIPLEQYRNEVSQWKQTVESLSNEVAYLKEQIEWFKKQIFGQKADKFIDPDAQQLNFEGFNELTSALNSAKQPVAAHERTKRKPNGKDKITFPEDLPVERQVLDIPEESKTCPETGKPLVKIGEEVTSKLAHKPGSYFIKQIIRPKYALPNQEGVCTAPLPESLLDRCLADESLLADILVKKFGDHLPLYRQSEIMAREGVYISRQILSKWVLRAGLALKPLYEKLLTCVLQSNHVF